MYHKKRLITLLSILFLFAFSSIALSAQILCVGENCAKRKVERGVRQTEVEDHAIQPVGDIIGVFEDNHIFSSTELDIFTIIKVEGFTKAELEIELPNVQLGKTIPDGSDDKWLDISDGKWKKLKKSPKFKLSISTLNNADKNKLKGTIATINQKKAIINKLKNRIKDYPENMVAAIIE